MSELDLIKDRYEKRKNSTTIASRYSYLNPSVYMAEQEKERALIRWIAHLGWNDLAEKRLLEVGCGSGGNLRTLMRLGFNPANLVGNELLADRYALARQLLPASTEVHLGDACTLSLPAESFDVVLQSTVFTSILDDSTQNLLATSMWRLVKPGGGILWYDFTMNNPKNSDVRGVKIERIKQLFPEASYSFQRITLAPPISRRICKINPALYTLFNCVPVLRTHVLAWIQKRTQQLSLAEDNS